MLRLTLFSNLILFLFISNGKTEYAFQAALNLVNAFRKDHEAPPLQVDTKLESLAEEYAEKLASHPRCKLRKSVHKDLGESLYMDPNNYPIFKKVPEIAIDAVNDWYNEVLQYDFDNPGFQLNAVHFTQMVWEETTSIGFGGATHPETKCVVFVAFYSPPGNFAIDYGKNVHPMEKLEFKEVDEEYELKNETLSKG